MENRWRTVTVSSSTLNGDTFRFVACVSGIKVKREGQLPVKEDKLATVLLYWLLRKTSPFASALDIGPNREQRSICGLQRCDWPRVGSHLGSRTMHSIFCFIFLVFSVEKWSLMMSPSTKMATKMSFCSRAGNRSQRKYLFDHECILYLGHVRFYDQCVYDGLAALKTK